MDQPRERRQQHGRERERGTKIERGGVAKRRRVLPGIATSMRYCENQGPRGPRARIMRTNAQVTLHFGLVITHQVANGPTDKIGAARWLSARRHNPHFRLVLTSRLSQSVGRGRQSHFDEWWPSKEMATRRRRRCRPLNYNGAMGIRNDAREKRKERWKGREEGGE